MNLIQRYTTEVGKHLTPRMRGDIEKELRSTLEGMLEDRAQKAGKPTDEAMVLSLLKEYGAPEKVAATYHPTNYLIGPRMYPFFVMVLKIVFSVLIVVLLIGLGARLAVNPPPSQGLAEAIWKGLLGIISGAISAFGNIVLVFAILERFVPAAEFKMDREEKEWNPADLMKEPEGNEVKMWEPIFGIVFTAAAFVIFNVYPQIIGISFVKGGGWTFIPALSEAFFRWMPWINVVWALQIALNVILLRQGRWQASTRWFSVAIDLAGIIIGYFLLIGPSIVGFTPEALTASGIFNAETANMLAKGVQQGARGIIALVMLVEGIEAIRTIYKLVTTRSIST